MLNPNQVAHFVNENITQGMNYNEKSIQKLIWKLLRKRYFVDPLNEVVVDTCWSNDSDTKYQWNLYKVNNFKEMFKTAIISLPTPGEKLAKKDIDVVDVFHKMYTGRIIPLVPLEPSGSSSHSQSIKGNLLTDISGDPMNSTNNTTNNLKLGPSITPTSKRNTGMNDRNQLY